MTSADRKPFEIFFSYSHKDQRLRDQLETQLSLLKREGLITSWYDHKITAGDEWAGRIDEHINTAQIILLLISADFIASDYCYSIEMTRALERHKAGDVSVIPIILRPTEWKQAPFSKLKPLPTSGKPVTKWSDRDSAFFDIAQGIRKAIEELKTKLMATKQIKEQTTISGVSQKTSMSWLREGTKLYEQKNYQDALAALEQAIQLDPNFARPYHLKGLSLGKLNRWEEALAAHEEAIRLDPTFDLPYYNKGRTLAELGRQEEALQAYEQAQQLGYRKQR